MIAQTYCRALFHKLQPDNDFFEKGTVHVHVPQGGIPKDGPSAGCTMVTALLSLAFHTPALVDVAMTGALSKKIALSFCFVFLLRLPILFYIFLFA